MTYRDLPRMARGKPSNLVVAGSSPAGGAAGDTNHMELVRASNMRFRYSPICDIRHAHLAARPVAVITWDRVKNNKDANEECGEAIGHERAILLYIIGMLVMLVVSGVIIALVA